MTNKQIVFAALRQAADARAQIFDIQEKVENIFGEESPLYKELQYAINKLNLAGDIDYELYGGNFGPGTEKEKQQVFNEWIEEEAEVEEDEE